jgi:uncharacterized iron-regulated protein
MRGLLFACCLATIFALTGGCAGTEERVQGWGVSPYPLTVEPQPDHIYHLPTGLKIPRDGFMDMISASDVVYVGETHTNVHAHRVQLEILRELHRRFPGQVAVGMEMFRVPQQESLDRWTKGELSELQFLKESKWFKNWSSDFGYYRNILEFARDNRIDVVALKTPRELEQHFGRSVAGGGELSPEIAAQLPETGPVDPYQEKSLQAIFRGHEGGQNMLGSFLQIHLLWEETMASRIVEYLDGERGRGKKMVVLTGSGHVQHGYGVPKKVLRRKPLSYAIVLPNAISIPEEKREALTMAVTLPETPLLAGDFLWLVSYEDLEDNRVRLGILMDTSDEGIHVKSAFEEMPAAKAGIMDGDRLVSVDGLAVEDLWAVILVVRSKKPGDDITVVIEREGEELTFTPRFPEGPAQKDK